MSDAGGVLYFNDLHKSGGISSATSKHSEAPVSSYSDIHSRRLRKAQPAPANDAAGLVAGSRYKGRNTPLKGKGSAQPPDNKYDTWTKTSSPTQGKSNLLSHEETDDTEGFMKRPCGNRPLSRMLDQSFKTHMKGSGLSPAYDEEQVKHPCKSPGIYTPTVNTSRVFAGARPDTADTTPATDGWPRSKCRPWALQVAEAEAKKQAEIRPQTAPSKLSRNMTVARQQYHATMHDANADVFQYRHSGGICPVEYKFAEVRQRTPPVELKPPGSAKEVFFDTRASYSSNRVKAQQSTFLY